MSKSNNELDCFFELLISILQGFGYNIEADRTINNWESFRDNFLRIDKDMNKEYECSNKILGDVIRKSSDDEDISDFYKILYVSFIVPFNKAFEAKDLDRAKSCYKQVVKLLLVYFSLESSYNQALRAEDERRPRGGFFGKLIRRRVVQPSGKGIDDSLKS